MLMTNSMFPTGDDEDTARPSSVTWRNRYDGVVAIAWIGDRQVAGISGPWSGKFALTWWDRPGPFRQLELFDTLDQAQAAVEAWALRMHYGLSMMRPAAAPHSRAALARPDLLARLRVLVFGRKQASRRATGDNLDSLRRLRTGGEVDPGDLHFTACEEPRAHS